MENHKNQGGYPSENDLAKRALTRLAEEAKYDATKFFDFVMQHELTHEPLTAPPHLRVLLSFAQNHNRAVVRLPVGFAKTVSSVSLVLWHLGEDPTCRGAIVSRTQGQAQKPLSMVSDYITDPTLAAALSVVFPHLRPSPRAKDLWTQRAITIDRPGGIRDPSLVAAGVGTHIAGSRFRWVVADDLVDDENSSTSNAQEDLRVKFTMRIISRLDPKDSQLLVCNTPWNRNDLTFYLEREERWPTLTMDCYGFIRLAHASEGWRSMAMDTLLRPSTTKVGGEYDWYRLRAHDPDQEEETPLWPERFSRETLDLIRNGDSDGRGAMPPHDFARLYLCDPFVSEVTRCQRDWIDNCKRKGAGLPLVPHYDGPAQTFTGVDVGIGRGREHDQTVLYTLANEADGRRILMIEPGRWSGPDIARRLVDTSRRYHSSIMVEGNQAQAFLAEFVREIDPSVTISSRPTTHQNKSSTDYGVESVFAELQAGKWIIPCDAHGRCERTVQRWIDECLYYQPPPAHPGDLLMASWIAREAARLGSRRGPPPRVGVKRSWTGGHGF